MRGDDLYNCDGSAMSSYPIVTFRDGGAILSSVLPFPEGDAALRCPVISSPGHRKRKEK